jgi:hypothetical protein
MKLKTVAMTGVLSLAGLGLIGAGAHAAWTTNTTSAQTINAGTPSVVLYASGATNNGTANITLATPGDVGSSFTTGDQQVQIYNNGNVAATETSVSIAGSTANDLYYGLQVCIATNNNAVIYNGPLSTAQTDSPITYPSPTTIAAGSSDYYYVNVYAGNEPTMCGGDLAGGYADTYGTDSTSDSNSLAPAAAGESQTYTLTVGYTS